MDLSRLWSRLPAPSITSLKMKIKEVLALSSEELLESRKKLIQEKIHLRIQQQNGQLENPARIWAVRKDLARIETVLSQKRLASKSS